MISACFEFATSEISELPGNTLPYLIEIQSRLGDYLMSSTSAEYEDELERLRSPTVRRLEERVERLLAGAAAEEWARGGPASQPSPEAAAAYAAARGSIGS